MARGGLSLGVVKKEGTTKKKTQGSNLFFAGVEGVRILGALKEVDHMEKKPTTKNHLNPQQDRVFLNSEREIDVEKSW